jgi:ribonuclease-3
MDHWNKLQSILDITFNDYSLLKQAFVHRSYLNENLETVIESNERLEFLGDALLSFVVAEDLYMNFTELDEGEMTKLRAALVCQESLAELAEYFKLGDYLFLGQGEEKNGGRGRSRNLACVMEALVGAIFVDQGFFRARDFILQLFDSRMKKAMDEKVMTDYKSRLQELAQANSKEIPRYEVVDTVGPDHDKEFRVEVLVGGKVVGKGKGKNKQSAEKEAARRALEKLLR